MMNIRLIQQLFAVCLMSLLIPAAAYATMHVENLTVTFANGYDFAAVPVPEPVTFWLLAAGIIGLVLLKRRPKSTDI